MTAARAIEAPARERELMLLCASPARESGWEDRVRELLESGPDWTYLLALANSHRLTQMLYWGVKSVRPEAVPPKLDHGKHTLVRGTLLRPSDAAV